MEPFSVLAWIVFYLVIVTLFYYCFRQSMSSVASTPPSTASRTTPQTQHSGSNNQRSNDRRTAYTAGHGRNVYLITDENHHRPSDASDIRSPPEYKWEDLPPSYEEAVGSFTNPTFDEQQQQQPIGSTSDVVDSTVIELPASATVVD